MAFSYHFLLLIDFLFLKSNPDTENEIGMIIKIDLVLHIVPTSNNDTGIY